MVSTRRKQQDYCPQILVSTTAIPLGMLSTQVTQLLRTGLSWSPEHFSLHIYRGDVSMGRC